MIPSVVVGKLASRVIEGAVGQTASEPPSASRGTTHRALERLARAEGALDVVEAYEGLAVPLAVLAGAAVVLLGRRKT
jgi:hypothetical protein